VQADADDRGILAALDLTTNRIAWRQQWREICYSGWAVTAGGLLFIGRSDGRLTALDKDDGALLCGAVFANAPCGDGIWMFSLQGTMRSLPSAANGPGGPTLIEGLTTEIAAVSGAGRNTMPGFGRVYSPAELRDTSSYVVDVLKTE
jgi:outer membrane protein assembly factor BamB